jgi:hypothetical protein
MRNPEELEKGEIRAERSVTLREVRDPEPLEALRTPSGSFAALMDVKTAAAYIGMSDDWLYDQAAKKKVPYFLLGKRKFFRAPDLDAWLESLLIKPQDFTQPTKKK